MAGNCDRGKLKWKVQHVVECRAHSGVSYKLDDRVKGGGLMDSAWSGIAGTMEVLERLTAWMRGSGGEKAGAATAGQLKAAELLARHYGLLTDAAACAEEAPVIEVNFRVQAED